MVRSVLFSVALSALLIYGILQLQSSYEQRLAVNRVTRIDIYSDRITYRLNSYSTPSLLAYALRAVEDPPKKVALHDCSRMGDFEAVLDLLRERRYTEFQIELPDSC